MQKWSFDGDDLEELLVMQLSMGNISILNGVQINLMVHLPHVTLIDLLVESGMKMRTEK